jgi:polysaccharide chain length determinant protein (PEP-CTERM system associated)
MNTPERTLSDFVAVLRRRRRPVVTIGVVVLLGFVVLAFALPAVYQSSATLLIEKPEVPPDLAGLRGPEEYVEKRLQIVNQRVMTTEHISALIKKFGLYADQPTTSSLEDSVGEFRAATLLTPSITEAVDARSMRAADLTYAFVLSFEYHDPIVTRDVAAALADMFVQESELEKRQTTARSLTFLSAEAERLQQQLREVETKLSDFKQRHAGALPDDRTQNLQRSQNAAQEIARVDGEIRSAEARRDLIATQLASTPMYRPVLSESGQPVLAAADRLAAAQQELLAALAKYSEEHPDVKRLRREIASLSAETSSQDSPAPTNPEYLQLQTQLRSSELAIRELSARRSETWAMRSASDRGLVQAPEVERAFSNLMRDYDLLQTQYRAVRTRHQEAELSQNITTDDKGERYVIVDPAAVPESPIRPNRFSVIFLGVVVALAAALGAASVLEASDPTVRGQKDIQALLRITPVGVIPVIKS